MRKANEFERVTTQQALFSQCGSRKHSCESIGHGGSIRNTSPRSNSDIDEDQAAAQNLPFLNKSNQPGQPPSFILGKASQRRAVPQEEQENISS